MPDSIPSRKLSQTWQTGTAAVAGGKIRGGSYGDPAAVPFHVWESFLDGMESGTAYTHQWRNFPELAAFCMASVELGRGKIAGKDSRIPYLPSPRRARTIRAERARMSRVERGGI